MPHPHTHDTIPTGRYRHYKGREYIVLGVARHSETEEPLVVYRQDYGDRGLWVRPAEMFTETVHVGEASVPRFRYVGPELSGATAESAGGAVTGRPAADGG